MVQPQTMQGKPGDSTPGFLIGKRTSRLPVTWSRRGMTPLMVAGVLALLLAMLSPFTPTTLSHNGSWSPPTTVYLPETGQTLDQFFLEQWRNGGGNSAYGYPITPEITQNNGHIIQYLEYARFEYWPEGDENGNTVVIGDIGAELRPITLPRSAAFRSPAQQASVNRETVTESARLMQAWLPVQADALAESAIFIEQTRHSVDLSFRTFWENTGGESYLGNPLTEEYILNGVTYQVFERGQLAWTSGEDPWMVPVGKVLADKYKLDQKPVAQGEIPTYSEDLFVPPPEPEPEVVPDAGPGAVPGTEKSIVVSISQQRMWAYEGDTAVLSSFVSTGKPGFDTPTGMFSISKKVEIQDMEGLIGGEYYNVTDVPDVMYFTAVGHAFHGAYWHNDFGSVMSHGCINLPTDVAATLYDWTPMYTPVQIVA
ncbi:MAG: L,D-transpeptidase [Chloroflexota bacterium]|nr:L,D-transpeptidase [Chloroflexota bacterium]